MKANKLLAGLFCLFLAGSLIVNVITPAKGVSQAEQRPLAQWPKWETDKALEGKFSEEVEEYVNDQFYGRDWWVSLKSGFLYALGQRELNGVFVAGDRFINGFPSIDESRLSSNLEAIKKLAQKSGKRVTLLMVPEGIAVYEELLPKNAPYADQQELYERVNAALKDSGVEVVWPLETLSQHKDEGIYFRTDHHWTARGAYHGANELLAALGRERLPAPEFETLSDHFYGTTAHKAGVEWFDPDILEAAVGVGTKAEVFQSDGVKLSPWQMFDESFLEKSDKYSYFQGGNQPLLVVKNDAGAGSALVLKDSFCNALLPYLSESFAELTVGDMRYNKMSMAAYAEMIGADEIILVYSPSSLATEPSLAFLGL